MYKLLILEPMSWDGCGWYRTRQFALLAKDNDLDVQYIDMSLSEQGLSQAIEQADAYLLRLSDLVAIEVFEQFEWDKIKKPIFLDIDDNYESIDVLSDLYRAYGTSDVQLEDGTYLWKDGFNFDAEKNKKRLDNFRMIMKKSSAVFVTTFELKNYAEQYNENVVIIPNAVDLARFPKLKDTNKRSNEIRLLWSGGSTHFPDLLEIRTQLENLLKNNLNLHLYILGVPFNGIIKNMPKDRVHPMGWVKPDGHSYRLAAIDADIAICPLKDFSFNYYKSSIKYYETAALRIPNVCKDMPPYKDDITDGVNGYLYGTPDEFQDKVQSLIDDPIKRIEIGNAGYEYVARNRQVASIAADWATFIKESIKIVSSKAINKPKTGKKHIVLAVGQFKSLTGSELYYYELAREYLRAGNQVTIVADEIGYPLMGKVKEMGGSVIKTDSISEIEPDVCIGSHRPIGVLAQTFKCPIIQVIHSENDFLWEIEKPQKGMTQYVAVRESIRKRAIADGVPAEKITTIWNPIDLSRFKPERYSEKTLLFVGADDALRSDVIKDVFREAAKKGLTVKLVGRDQPNPETWDIEQYVNKCAMTASIYMGRTTLEGWAADKPSLVYQVDGRGKILSKKVVDPKPTEKYDSTLVAKRILELC